MNFPFFFGWNQVQFQYFFFRWLPNPIIWIIVSQKVVCRCLLSHFCFFFPLLWHLWYTHTHISLKTFTRHWLCFVISPVVISSLGEINWSSSLEKKKGGNFIFNVWVCTLLLLSSSYFIYHIFFFFFGVCIFLIPKKIRKNLQKYNTLWSWTTLFWWFGQKATWDLRSTQSL